MKSSRSKQSLRLRKEELISTAVQTGIKRSQAEKLWSLLYAKIKPRNLFSLPNMIWYLGVLVLFSALIFLGNEGYTTYGAKGLLLVSLFSAFLLSTIGVYFWRSKTWRFWGGCVLLLALALTPLIMYSFLDFLGWPKEAPTDIHALIRHKWMVMEVVTIGATSTAIYFMRFPPFSILLYLSSWAMTIDVFYSLTENLGWNNYPYSLPSLIFGLGLITVSWMIDKKTRLDFAFWGYLIGSFSFWIAINQMQYRTEWGYFGYFLMNILLVVIGSLLKRTALLCFGSLGVLIYLILLAFRHFSLSPLFFFIMILIGLGIIAIGVTLQRYPRFHLTSLFHKLKKWR